MSTIELGSLQAELGALDTLNLGGFTPITVTASASLFGPAAAGTVTFTLTQPISNAGVLIPCTPVIITLDSAGGLTAALVATDDPGSAPQGVWYGVTEQLVAAQPRDYFIQLSASGPSTVRLADLMPTSLPWQ